MARIREAVDRRRSRLETTNREINSLDTRQQEIHRIIAETAQVQDRALVKQRSLKQQLDTLSFPDDEEKRKDLNVEIAALGEKAKEAEKSLGALFDQQDELTQQTDGLQNQAEQIQDDILELNNELESIRQWANSQKRAATVKVSGSVVQGTIIAGPHTRSLIKSTCKHVTIREVKNIDPDSALEYEIKIQS